MFDHQPVATLDARCAKVVPQLLELAFRLLDLGPKDANTLGHLVTETLNANGISKDQLDWLIPHQANIRIIEAIAKRLELPMERVIVTINTQGNTSAASVPLALDTGIRDGRVKRGQLLLLEAFGGGFTWGSALVRY